MTKADLRSRARGTLWTRFVSHGALLGRRDEVPWHALRLSSRKRIAKVEALGTDDLDVLHHAAILVAKDVAVEHKLAGEVDG